MQSTYPRDSRTPTTTPSTASDPKSSIEGKLDVARTTVAVFADLIEKLPLEADPIEDPVSSWPLRSIYIRHALTAAEKDFALALANKAKDACVKASLDPNSTALSLVLSPSELRDVTRLRPGPLLPNFRPSDAETSGMQPAVYPIETRLFRGRLIVRLVGFEAMIPEGEDGDELKAYFAGRKRVMQFVVQGSFKEKLAFADVLTGQIFQRQLSLPESTSGLIFCKMGLLVLRAFSSSLVEDMISKSAPFFLSPLISSYQTVHVTPDGEAPPDISKAGPIVEDMSYYGTHFRKGHSRDRQKYFGSCPTRLKQFAYEPNVTYTFESYQHQFRFEDFTLRTPMKEFTIASYMNFQPIELMALIVTPDTNPCKNQRARLRRIATGESPSSYLWRLQIFHRDASMPARETK